MLEIKEDLLFTDKNTKTFLYANTSQNYLFLHPEFIASEEQKIKKIDIKLNGSSKSDFIILERKEKIKAINKKGEDQLPNKNIVKNYNGILAIKNKENEYTILNSKNEVLYKGLSLSLKSPYFDCYAKLTQGIVISITGKIHKTLGPITVQEEGYFIETQQNGPFATYVLYDINCEPVKTSEDYNFLKIYCRPLKRNENEFKKEELKFFKYYLKLQLENRLLIKGASLRAISRKLIANDLNAILNLENDEVITGKFTKQIELINNNESIHVYDLNEIHDALYEYEYKLKRRKKENETI